MALRPLQNNPNPQPIDTLAQQTYQVQQSSGGGGSGSDPKPQGGLNTILDLLSRGNYASANVALGLLKNKGSITQNFIDGITGKAKTRYSDVLDQAGVGDLGSIKTPLGNITGKGVLGFGLDVALDPTTYIAVGAVGKGAKLAEVLGVGTDKVLNRAGVDLAEKAIGKFGIDRAAQMVPKLIENTGAKYLEEGVAAISKARGGVQFMGRTLPGLSAETIKGAADFTGATKAFNWFRDTSVGSWIGKSFIPKFRPPEISPEEWKKLTATFDAVKKLNSQDQMKVYDDVFRISRSYSEKERIAMTEAITKAKGGDIAQHLQGFRPEVVSEAQYVRRRLDEVFLKESGLKDADIKKTLDALGNNGLRRADLGKNPLTKELTRNFRDGYIPGLYKKTGDKITRHFRPKVFANFEQAKAAGYELVNNGDIATLFGIRGVSSANQTATKDLYLRLAENFGTKNELESLQTMEQLKSGASKLRPQKDQLQALFSDKSRVVAMLKSRVNDLEKKGLRLSLRKDAVVAPDTISSGIKQMASGELRDIPAQSMMRGERSTKRFINSLLTTNDPTLDFVKKQISVGEKDAKKISDMLAPIKEKYIAIDKKITESMDQFGRLKQGLTSESSDLFRGKTTVANSGMKDFLRAKYKGDVLFDEHVAGAIDNYMGKSAEGPVKGFLKFFDKGNNLFKSSVTTLFPSFHSRNLASNLWNMHLAGVNNPARMVHAGEVQKISRALRMGDEETLAKFRGKLVPGTSHTYEEVARQAVLEDVKGTGWFTGELDPNNFLQEQTTKVTNALGAKGFKGTVVDSAKHPINTSRKLGAMIEDNSRLALFIDRLAKGDNFAEAADTTKKFLFDYGELTPFERQIMGRIIPFYTWSRKNIPLQVEQLIRQPGKYTSIPKAGGIIADKNPMSPQEEAYLPDYIQKKYHIRLPGNSGGVYRYVAPDLAFQDLARLTDPSLNQELSSMTPIIKAVFEFMQNKDLLKGRQLADENLPKEAGGVLSQTRSPFNVEKFRTLVTNNLKVSQVWNRLSGDQQSTVDKIIRDVGGMYISSYDPVTARKYWNKDQKAQKSSVKTFKDKNARNPGDIVGAVKSLVVPPKTK